jgi:glycosyltransferase involved in cell wall biosynthesis
MKLLFSGCARDCAGTVYDNISALLAIGDLPWCEELRVYVAENGSKDDTRLIVSHLAVTDSRVVPLFLDDIDEQIPAREARIAFCRDRLLDEILKTDSDGLYIPIDLDSGIASSMDADALRQACQLVAFNQCTAVFPASYPYYYDIYALREVKWCPRSCWKQIHDAKARGSLWSLFVHIRYLSSRQKPLSQLQAEGLIPIDSAFGGVGIYSLAIVAELGARYFSRDLLLQHLRLCEHVVFNAFFDRLFIYPQWVIRAPSEHIEFRVLPFHYKVLRIIRAVFRDIMYLPFAIAKLFAKRVFNGAGG